MSTIVQVAQNHNELHQSYGPTQKKIFDVIASLIAPLGYEVVHLEFHTHRDKTIQLFIDRLAEAENDKAGGIGIEDCANVSRVLDEPLDALPELDALFQGAPYELEVSSPGVDRPLRTAKDFTRFAGREIRVHTFRPLTAEECGNAPYQAKNSKQKNFLGRLSGLEGEGEKSRVRIALSANDGVKPGKKKGVSEAKREEILIPLALISKANLEPDFDFDGLED